MRTIQLAAVFAFAIGGSACVGSLQTGGDNTQGDDTTTQSAARQEFEAEVSPMLQAACAGCHTGAPDTQPLKYLGNSGTTGFYAAITQAPSVVGGYDPSLAQLLLQGVHDSGAAPAWSETQKTTITSWLASEAEERGITTQPDPNPGVTTPTTSREALAQWSACMNQDDWNTAQMTAWARAGTDRGACESCHNSGAGGYFAINDDTKMFMMNQYEIYITTFFTASPIDLADPSKGYQVLPNEAKLRLKANTVGHPSFNPDGNNKMQHLQDFYDLTKARVAAGTCPPAGFPTAPPPQ
jgi:hypothetical protein